MNRHFEALFPRLGVFPAPWESLLHYIRVIDASEVGQCELAKYEL